VHRFLVDAQLPPALARKIEGMGHAAEHLLDVGLLESSDSRIWDYALANSSVIVTKDEDFAIRASISRASPPIVWVRIANCPNERLLAWFENEMPSVIAALDAGNLLVEIAG
jgi:predicted nuclease of predicted toxin-antitoxin system